MPYSEMPENVRNAYDRVYSLANDWTGGAKVCEDFLFAWYNVKAWGGWAPQSITGLDSENAAAVLILLSSIHQRSWYPDSADMDKLAKRKGREPLSRA